MELLLDLITFSQSQLNNKSYQTFLKNLSPAETSLYKSLESKNPRSHSDRNYSVEASLLQKLKQHAFQLEISNTKLNVFQRAYYNSYINVALVKILLGLQYRKGGIELAKRTYSVANKYHFTDIVAITSRHIFSHLQIYSASKKDAQRFKDIHDEALLTLSKESTALYYHGQLSQTFHKSKIPTREYIEHSKRLFEELKPSLHHLKSWSFHLYTFLVGIFHYLSDNNYQKAIETCQEAIGYFEGLPFRHIFSINLFQNYLAYSYLNEEKFDQSIEVLYNVLNTTKPYKAQWYNASHYIVLNYLRLENYDKANAILNDAIKHKNFKRLMSQIKKRWYLAEAYIELHLLLQGKPRLPNKIFKFLNDDNYYSKDKKSKNLNLLILEFLFYFSRNLVDEIVDKLDSISRYRRRYLAKSQPRDYAFVKMLELLTKFHLSNSQLTKAAKNNLTILKANPRKTSLNVEESEIIPYEILWNAIIQHRGTRLQEIDNKYRHKSR